MFGRFISNGIWDLKHTKSKRVLTEYPCCPNPYIDLVYTLILRRSSSFYVGNVILPCAFLSLLSLMVFYLPPDCGEKLTLSITNLLALVVFQQLIAETLPPTGEESPIMGKFTFLIKMLFNFYTVEYQKHTYLRKRKVRTQKTLIV